MNLIRPYSAFVGSLATETDLKNGVVADTNILISATYDLDPANEEASIFFDQLAELKVPVFCNVNVRTEFLEIHRRIIFTEALLDYESQVSKSTLPKELSNKLTSIRSQAGQKQRKGLQPLRLAEAELKNFKRLMTPISVGNTDLWSALCEERVGNKLSAVWDTAESDLGLNFLSLRKSDQASYFNSEPNWDDAMKLMESHGLSSSDAMIFNLFLCSKFLAIVTSDWDVATSVKKNANASKIAFCPPNII